MEDLMAVISVMGLTVALAALGVASGILYTNCKMYHMSRETFLKAKFTVAETASPLNKQPSCLKGEIHHCHKKHKNHKVKFDQEDASTKLFGEHKNQYSELPMKIVIEEVPSVPTLGQESSRLSDSDEA